MLAYVNLSPLTVHAQNLSNYNICWRGLGGEKAEKAKQATEFSYFRGLICLVEGTRVDRVTESNGKNS